MHTVRHHLVSDVFSRKGKTMKYTVFYKPDGTVISTATEQADIETIKTKRVMYFQEQYR